MHAKQQIFYLVKNLLIPNRCRCEDRILSKTRNPLLLRQLRAPANRRSESRATAFEQLSLDREAGKLPGPSCTSERACKPHLLLHQSRPRYTMLDWHPSAQINMARLEPRVTTSALEMWHWSLLSCLERERHELQSMCTRRCQAPGPGRRDVQCLVQINCRPRQSVLSL